MSKVKFTIILVVVIGVSVVAINSLKAYQASQIKASAEISKTKGNPKSNIKIVEYIDFQCPACAEGSKYLKQFIKDHPQAIHLQMRYFPLDMHKHGMLSARYAECASQQEKFWAFQDLLVEKQSQWKNLPDAKPFFDVFANELGLDAKKLDACLIDPKTEEKINEDKKRGQQLNVRSTPTYFVNNKMIVGSKSLMVELAEVVHDTPK